MKNKTKIICLILAILLFAFMAVASSNDDDDDKDFSIHSGSSKSSSKSDEKESDDADNDDEESSENNKLYVGDTLDVKGLKITYEKAEKYTSDNEFIQPEKGNMYIRMFFSIKNDSGKDKTIGSFDFECYADGEACNKEYLTGDEVLDSVTTLSDGRSTKGYVYFEVPKTAKVIEVEYETSWLKSSKAIFVYEL